MANTIKHKRGSGSDPSASDLAVGELAIRTDTGVVFTKKDDGTVAEISGGGQTNLGVSTTTTAVTVTSDTGNNATISEASGSAAGVMSVAHHDKLDGIESNATADQSASEILTAIKTVDGSGSGLDADTLDGVEASSFLRSDTADTASGDITFSGGAAAVNIAANSDIRLPNGTSWTGDTTDPKIQAYDNYLYILGGSNGIVFRENNTNRALIDTDGHFKPASDDTYDLGTSSKQWRNGYFDGTVNADGLDVDGDADITGTTTLHGNLDLQDNDSILIGTGDDLQLFHNGSNSYIDNATNDLYVRQLADDRDVIIQSDNGSGGVADYIVCDGSATSVNLYYAGSQKFATQSDGVGVTGRLQCTSLDVDGGADITGNVTLHANLDLQDLDRILLGTGDDLQILHDGAQSYLAADDLRIVNNAISETQAIFLANGAVSLYYNNSKKFDTKSDGVDITGELQCDSLDVDGAANITGNLDIDENIRHNGDTNNYIGFPAADTFRVVTGGTERVRITSTGALAIEGSSNYGTSGQVLTSNGNDAPTWQDGGGTVADGCVYENSQTISNNYTVSTNKNAMSAGPITVNSGVTITVPSGSTYTVI